MKLYVIKYATGNIYTWKDLGYIIFNYFKEIFKFQIRHLFLFPKPLLIKLLSVHICVQ